MEIIVGLALLLVPLLVVLTVLASLGWVGKRLLRLTERTVRNA
jgi:type III secretory pathway component EscS